MSLPIETIAEIAENVYFTVVDELNLQYKCIEVDDNGFRNNTEYGMELYYLIESAVQEIVGGNDDL